MSTLKYFLCVLYLHQVRVFRLLRMHLALWWCPQLLEKESCFQSIPFLHINGIFLNLPYSQENFSINVVRVVATTRVLLASATVEHSCHFIRYRTLNQDSCPGHLLSDQQYSHQYPPGCRATGRASPVPISQNTPSKFWDHFTPVKFPSCIRNSISDAAWNGIEDNICFGQKVSILEEKAVHRREISSFRILFRTGKVFTSLLLSKRSPLQETLDWILRSFSPNFSTFETDLCTENEQHLPQIKWSVFDNRFPWFAPETGSGEFSTTFRLFCWYYQDILNPPNAVILRDSCSTPGGNRISCQSRLHYWMIPGYLDGVHSSTYQACTVSISLYSK